MRIRIPAPLAAAVLALGSLRAQSSDVPLAINLPTADRMQFWDIGVVFTHRFVTPARGHGKDLYGLDGLAYAGFGFHFGIKPVKGLNVEVYRTADNKTWTFTLHQQVLDRSWIRMAARAQRFDESVTQQDTPLGSVGISGAAFQLPTEFYLTDDLVVTLVPTWLSRSTTRDKSLFTAGAGLRYDATEKLRFLVEYYPRPSRLAQVRDAEGRPLESGFAAGVSYKTFKHRFTLVGTNTTGTTPNQVLGGDYGGGPRPKGDWSLAFNVARVF